MKICETGTYPTSTASYHAEIYQDGQWSAIPVNLASEFRLTIDLDGSPLTCITCSAQDTVDLCIGWLLSNGAVRSAGDILSVHLDRHSGSCRVTVNRTALSEATLPVIRKHAPWKPEWAALLDHAMRENTSLYRKTNSFHSCILLRDGQILCVREDIGRHNALDKAIGWAVRNDIRLEQCLAFSSARLPSDLVEKAICGGITVLASKALPTVEAAALAKAHGLTLLHYSARRGLLRFV